jgi:hypothetical protein
MQLLYQLLDDRRNHRRQFWKGLRQATTDLPISLSCTRTWDSMCLILQSHPPEFLGRPQVNFSPPPPTPLASATT